MEQIKQIINKQTKIHSFPLGRLGWEKKMADYKRIIKNVLFVALVPSVVVAGYYGYQYYKKKKKEADGDNLREKDGKKADLTFIPTTKLDTTKPIIMLKPDDKKDS